MFDIPRQKCALLLAAAKKIKITLRFAEHLAATQKILKSERFMAYSRNLVYLDKYEVWPAIMFRLMVPVSPYQQ